MSNLLVDGGLRISDLLYQLYGLALLCLLVRMTFDQSSGHGNLNHLLVVMICMHLLGKGDPPPAFLKKSSLSLKVLSSEAREERISAAL